MIEKIMDFSKEGSNHQYMIKVLTSQMDYRVCCINCNSVFIFDDNDIDNRTSIPRIICPKCKYGILLNENYRKRKLELETTNRGFKNIKFKDALDKECSLQESSSFEPRIWFGKDEVEIKLFLPDIDKSKQGWIDYPLPDCVRVFGRMELSQSQVQELLPYLQYFAENGCLPEEKIDKETD